MTIHLFIHRNFIYKSCGLRWADNYNNNGGGGDDNVGGDDSNDSKGSVGDDDGNDDDYKDNIRRLGQWQWRRWRRRRRRRPSQNDMKYFRNVTDWLRM